MEAYIERMGVWTVTAIVAAVVISYALWASYLLRQDSALASQNAPAAQLSINT